MGERAPSMRQFPGRDFTCQIDRVIHGRASNRKCPRKCSFLSLRPAEQFPLTVVTVLNGRPEVVG
jgi:hypothetical protein